MPDIVREARPVALRATVGRSPPPVGGTDRCEASAGPPRNRDGLSSERRCRLLEDLGPVPERDVVAALRTAMERAARRRAGDGQRVRGFHEDVLLAEPRE